MDNPNLHQDDLSPFEKAKRTDESGNEFWSSRDLAKILQYQDYRNFLVVIERAKTACLNSDQRVDDHFGDITEMIPLGKGAKREVEVIMLSRYACYLVIQNADPQKEMVALGQTYFAVQTRKHELFEQANEDERRVILRQELRKHNSALADAASNAGVLTGLEFAIFQNHGYKGLYGGLDQKDIHSIKGLKKSQKILDHMGSTELAANLFRATQTEEKLRRDRVNGKDNANKVHFQVGKKVRETIEDLGGTMPEELPSPKQSIQQIERRLKKQQKLEQD